MEQPQYYELLANIGRFAQRLHVRALVAVSPQGELLGGVVFFGEMALRVRRNRDHGDGCFGIRLLGVTPKCRGLGAGRALTLACVALARQAGRSQVILHTTRALQVAGRLYERPRFLRSADLAFEQQGLPVFGFRLTLT